MAAGELVEIGDGFRMPDVLRAPARACARSGRRTASRSTTTGGAGPQTGAVLKVHPSQLRRPRFHPRGAGRRARGALPHGVPLVADIGSGLLRPHPLLPDEPDLQTALARRRGPGAASGDKLLGGPQAGLVLGRADLVAAAATAPALPGAAGGQDDAGRAGGDAARPGAPGAGDAAPPTSTSCARGPARLAAGSPRPGSTRRRSTPTARVGGGGAPELPLPSAAVSLPAAFAEPLRPGRAAGRRVPSRAAARLLDLRSLPPADDDALAGASWRSQVTAPTAWT